MAISVQPNTAQPLPQNAAQTLAQALRAGQVVEARVAGGGANGATQLAIGGQIVEAALAVRLPPGTLIQLLVQGAGQNARLTVLLQTSPAPTPANAPTPQPAQGHAPQAAQPQPHSVQTPQALPPQSHPAQTQSSGGQLSNQPAPQLPQTPLQAFRPQLQTVQPNAPAAATQPQGHPQQAPTQIVLANARPVLVTAPVPPGSPATVPVVQPQTVQSVPQSIAAISQTRVPQIEPGTVLRVQISGTGANARPVLVPVAPAAGGEIAKPFEQAQPQQALPVQIPNPVQQALTQTVQQSVARQDSITVLLTNLAGFGAKLTELPNPVARAGTQVLAGRLNLTTRPLDGAGLKAALTKSGTLFESALLQGSAKAPPAGDLKGALLSLRTALGSLLGHAGAGKAARPQNAPPPPTPHTPPRADRPVSLPLTPSSPNAETPAKLLGQSEAALARMRLVQISSLPEAAARPGQGPSGTAPEMNFELPLIFGGELSVGQFQIFKDGSGGAEGDKDREWKMRFSINFSQIGEVGATVFLRGGKTAVMLWAEREETANVLQEMSGELADSLSARGLEPGAIRCRHGHPPQAKKPVGAFMDNSS